MATSNEKSVESLDNPTKLETLKRLRENVNWEMEDERRGLLNQLYPLVKDWTNQLPNLRDIFRPEEIDWFLIESTKSANLKNFRDDIVPFVNFLRRTGYKDEPKLDEDGTPLWRRTTPVSSYYTRLVIFDLFKIYEKYRACQHDRFGSIRRFLELDQDPNCLIRKTGRSTLHLALINDESILSSLLLTEGANPSLADMDGLTPLHIACKVLNTDLVIKKLLKYPMVQVDALDKLGRTPLHYNVMNIFGVQKKTQVLLENGANPNSADLDGLRPLHLICQGKYVVNLVEPFFKICGKNHQLVQVDPLDNRGRTPLYYAVASLLPNAVDFLLNQGADLSSLVFPTESDFDEGIKVWLEHYDYKLRIAPCAMSVVENLEKRGYELDQGDVLMIMKWFAKYGLFEKSEELEKCLYKDEEFVSKAKNQMIRTGVPPYNKCCYQFLYYNYDDDDDDDDEMEDEDGAEEVVKKTEESLEGPSLSLYELIQLRPEEIEKLLTYWDYKHFRHACSRWGLTDRAKLACVVHLCEMRSRRFFRRWAVYPFWDLIHQRLPLEVCEMVVGNLTNEDLYHICLAAQGQSS